MVLTVDPGDSQSIHSTTLPSLAFPFLIVFPFSGLHFPGDNSLLFRITRSNKSSECRRACWLRELLLTIGITNTGRTRTPRTLSHQLLAHLQPLCRVQGFSGPDSKAKFGVSFTGHHKMQAHYLELHFKPPQHRGVQENQSLLQSTLFSFLHLPKSKFRAC